MDPNSYFSDLSHSIEFYRMSSYGKTRMTGSKTVRVNTPLLFKLSKCNWNKKLLILALKNLVESIVIDFNSFDRDK